MHGCCHVVDTVFSTDMIVPLTCTTVILIPILTPTPLMSLALTGLSQKILITGEFMIIFGEEKPV